MKVKVIKPFRDKTIKDYKTNLRKVNSIIDITKERYEELKGYVEVIEKDNSKKE